MVYFKIDSIKMSIPRITRDPIMCLSVDRANFCLAASWASQCALPGEWLANSIIKSRASCAGSEFNEPILSSALWLNLDSILLNKGKESAGLCERLVLN